MIDNNNIRAHPLYEQLILQDNLAVRLGLIMVIARETNTDMERVRNLSERDRSGQG